MRFSKGPGRETGPFSRANNLVASRILRGDQLARCQLVPFDHTETIWSRDVTATPLSETRRVSPRAQMASWWEDKPASVASAPWARSISSVPCTGVKLAGETISCQVFSSSAQACPDT